VEDEDGFDPVTIRLERPTASATMRENVALEGD